MLFGLYSYEYTYTITTIRSHICIILKTCITISVNPPPSLVLNASLYFAGISGLQHKARQCRCAVNRKHAEFSKVAISLPTPCRRCDEEHVDIQIYTRGKSMFHTLFHSSISSPTLKATIKSVTLNRLGRYFKLGWVTRYPVIPIHSILVVRYYMFEQNPFLTFHIIIIYDVLRQAGK